MVLMLPLRKIRAALLEKLGIDPSLPRVISDSLTRAVNSGFDKSELPAIVEVLRKR